MFRSEGTDKLTVSVDVGWQKSEADLLTVSGVNFVREVALKFNLIYQNHYQICVIKVNYEFLYFKKRNCKLQTVNSFKYLWLIFIDHQVYKGLIGYLIS